MYWRLKLKSFFQGTRWNQILKGHLNFDCCLTGTFSAIAQNSQEFQLTQVTLKLNYWLEFLVHSAKNFQEFQLTECCWWHDLEILGICLISMLNNMQ